MEEVVLSIVMNLTRHILHSYSSLRNKVAITTEKNQTDSTKHWHAIIPISLSLFPNPINDIYVLCRLVCVCSVFI